MNKLKGKMKKFFSVNQGAIRLIVTILCLALFVLAAGAPNGMGGIGMQSVETNDGGGHCQMSVTGLNHIQMNALAHMSMKAPVWFCAP